MQSQLTNGYGSGSGDGCGYIGGGGVVSLPTRISCPEGDFLVAVAATVLYSMKD